MKYIIATIFIGFYLVSFSQRVDEKYIKQFAQQINNQIEGIDLGNGITGRGCAAVQRTLIYQYNVDEFWCPLENMKNLLLDNFKRSGCSEFCFNNDVSVDFNYYYGNILQKGISIKSQEFSNLNFDLGDYISIKDHPKGKGVNLKIRLPIGWEIKEGDRPNIVKKFIYNNNLYMIIVKENVTFFSRNEILETFEDKDCLNELIINANSSILNPKILKQDIVTVDRYPSVVYTMKGQVERLGGKMSLIIKEWIIYYEDKIIFLQCWGLNVNEFYALEEFYNLITNSVIFPEQYN